MSQRQSKLARDIICNFHGMRFALLWKSKWPGYLHSRDGERSIDPDLCEIRFGSPIANHTQSQRGLKFPDLELLRSPR